MRPAMTESRPGTGLLYLITSGLLWGTGGLTGSLLSRVAGLSAMSVAAWPAELPPPTMKTFFPFTLMASGRAAPNPHR